MKIIGVASSAALPIRKVGVLGVSAGIRVALQLVLGTEGRRQQRERVLCGEGQPGGKKGCPPESTSDSGSNNRRDREAGVAVGAVESKWDYASDASPSWSHFSVFRV